MKKSITVTLKGVSPLLMHAFPLVPLEAFEKQSKEDQAEYAAYRTPEGKLYLPGIALQRAFVAGAAYSKGKGRATLAKIAAAVLMVPTEYLILDEQEYIIDARPVVNPVTKGRIVRYRPRFDAWEVTVDVEYDSNHLTEEQVHKIVEDTGNLVGVLDFRPEKKGMFGRFLVTGWKVN